MAVGSRTQDNSEEYAPGNRSRRSPLVRWGIDQARRHLPHAVRRPARRALTVLRQGRLRPRWGNLRSPEPFSDDYGWERGTPVDRVYIAEFMTANASALRGACLEVLDTEYLDRYGGAAVTATDVVDIDPGNLRATVIADLGEDDSLPPQRYDTFVLMQTLHLIGDYTVALRNAWQTLRPGGVLLLTVPALSPHQPTTGLEHDLWRFTPAGLSRVLATLFPEADIQVTGYGNLVACTAFLHGIVSEELRPRDLARNDPRFPLLTAARVTRPVSGPAPGDDPAPG